VAENALPLDCTTYALPVAANVDTHIWAVNFLTVAEDIDVNNTTNTTFPYLYILQHIGEVHISHL